MKTPIRPIWSNNILLAVLCAGVISLVLSSSLLIHVNMDHVQFVQPSDIGHHDEKEVFLAPADFSLTHQQGKQENLERMWCSSLQKIRIIRSGIFDEAQQAVLSQRLACFTQPFYFHTLSPIWQPSIPIAHRKLVI